MNLDEARAAIEEHMLAQAESVGELLEQFRSRIPAVLVGGPGWDKLMERTRGLPISLATAGFGFEFRLHEQEPRADLGLALFQGSRSAAHFEAWSRSRPEDASAAAVVRLLHEMGREESELRRIAAKLLLEYDIDPAHHGRFPDPGIFLYPTADALPDEGTVQEPEDLRVLVDAVAMASGWETESAERRHAERLFLARPPGAQIGGLGAFPARRRGLRMAITGIRSTRELTSFLERAGWPGRPATFAPFVSDLEARGAFSHLAAHLDVHPGGVRPDLGVSFYAQDTQWLKDIEPWMGIIDGLRAPGLVVQEKLSALAESWAGVETVFGRRGLLLVVRGIHHFKVSLVGDRFEEVKAYVFCLVFPPLQADSATAGSAG
ncbi:MAG: hypothetical protein F4Y74_12680 [Gemmatimonadales bacterium]|nr:hypothetical protein [Gemmatimonadales bacterium]MYG20370.1 hypothetical protein [Gemmatimonadales bacterium]